MRSAPSELITATLKYSYSQMSFLSIKSDNHYGICPMKIAYSGNSK